MPLRPFQPTITLDELARRNEETLAEQRREADSGQQDTVSEDDK